MKDPLTKKERKELMKTFEECFEEKYQAALKSGAVSEEFGHKGDLTLAKCCLVIASEGYAPFSPARKAFLKNLRHFV